VRQQWGKLTDDDLTRLSGKTEELAGVLQQRYGYGKDQAEDEIHKWLNSNVSNRSAQKLTDRIGNLKNKKKIEDKIEDQKNKSDDAAGKIGDLKNKKKIEDKIEDQKNKSDDAAGRIEDMKSKIELERKIEKLKKESAAAKGK